MRKFDYKGISVEYDETAFTSWKVQTGLLKGDAEAYHAIDRILAGRSDEYAEQLGDSMEEMAELVKALVEDAAKDEPAKN